MPISYEVLRKFGTHEDRVRELFTSNPALLPDDATDEQKKDAQDDFEMRTVMQNLLANRLNEAILQNLKHSYLHAAVDLAWDSSIITRATIPLVMYAQRRVSSQACINQLEQLKCQDEYTRYDEKTQTKKVMPPKFSEVNINLVRSIISRRVAAQSARYTDLYPHFKFEPRGTSQADKLRADVLSQRLDIMADQYGYRQQQVELIRDMLLYPHVMAFPACKWDREVEWYDEDVDKAVEFQTGKATPKSRVKREGVPLIVPHPSRVFYDMNHAITSINSDTGCEWFGFWDVVRYSSILDNPDYFNRGDITYHPDATSWFYSYSAYFSQYYTTINPPMKAEDIASNNDRKGGMDRYTAQMRDSSVYLVHVYWKLKPNQWRLGDYPHPIWLHLVVANAKSIIGCEIMPDCPGFVFSYNESAQRMVNLSMAHDILPFQDQLTNLYSQLLECIRRDLWGLAILNTDAFPSSDPNSQKLLEEFRAAMRSENFYSAISILEVSISKLKDLSIDLDSVFKVIRQPPNTQLSAVLNAISQTIMLAERVMALSPQEQAQLSPRETSATEVQVIAGTTENIYQFISDAIDEGRAAIKRYLYNAVVSLGTEEIYLPVINRYRKEIAEQAGFRVVDEEEAPFLDSTTTTARQFSVVGTKRNLIAEYIFNSRDGAQRSSNIQSAQALTQMMGLLLQTPAAQMINRGQFADLINTIVRQSGAGVDLIVEPQPGSDTMPLMPDPTQAPPPPQPGQAQPGPAIPAGPGPGAAAPMQIPPPVAAAVPPTFPRN